MKLKGILIALVVVGLSLLSSCKGGYTCPTYSQDTDKNQPEMAKELPTSKEVNS